MFAHPEMATLNLTPGQINYVGQIERGAPVPDMPGWTYATLATNTTQPMYVAPALTDCRTCGAPDQTVGVKCHYCAKRVVG